MSKHRNPIAPERIVEAVRGDEIVGRGTCSVIDECWTDDDLVVEFAKCREVRHVIAAARRIHTSWLDRQDDVANA